METFDENVEGTPANMAESVVHLNSKLMRVLVLVPEFQEEIKTLRMDKRFPIMPYIKTNRGAAELIVEWFQKRKVFPANSTIEGVVGFDLKKDRFFGEIKKIGQKFKLPYNLYNDALTGIPAYVLTNKIIVPEVNFTYVVENKGVQPEAWLEFKIKIYQFLTEQEFKKITDKIKELQSQFFPRSKEMRARPQEFEATLPAIEELLRLGNRKSKSKGQYYTFYRQSTRNKIAKKYKLEGNTLEKYLENLNQFARERFGYPLYENST